MQVLPRSHKIEVVHVVSICCNYVPEYIQDFIQRTVDVGGHPVADPVFINLKSQSVTNGNATAALKCTAPMFAGELATGTASYAVSHAGRQNYADFSLLARAMYGTVRMTLIAM